VKLAKLKKQFIELARYQKS